MTGSCNQAVSLCAISSGTLCDRDSDRHTMRIYGQMYFGVSLLLSGSYPDYHL